VEPYTLNLIWKYVENYDQHVLARVAYEDKQIYFNNVVSTKVIDEKNGKVLSEFPLHATRISFFDKNLYSFLAGENVQSVDAVNGNVVWNAEVNTGAIFILNDSIFLIDKSKHELKKLDGFTGNLIWRTSWNNQKVKRIEEINKYNIIQDADDSIYLVNKSSGDKLWSFSETLDSKKMFWSQYDKYLFISDGKDKIYIFDTEKVVDYETQNPIITPSLNVETEK
jgi:outer membrane protein assembly factor BamB